MSDVSVEYAGVAQSDDSTSLSDDYRTISFLRLFAFEDIARPAARAFASEEFEFDE